MVGVWAGWYLSIKKDKLSKSKNILGWIVAILTMNIIIYGQFYKEPSAIICSLSAAIGRTIWAMTIVFVIISCTMGNGGILPYFYEDLLI